MHFHCGQRKGEVKKLKWNRHNVIPVCTRCLLLSKDYSHVVPLLKHQLATHLHKAFTETEEQSWTPTYNSKKTVLALRDRRCRKVPEILISDKILRRKFRWNPLRSGAYVRFIFVAGESARICSSAISVDVLEVGLSCVFNLLWIYKIVWSSNCQLSDARLPNQQWSIR